LLTIQCILISLPSLKPSLSCPGCIKMVFYHRYEIQAGSLLFGGTNSKGIASNYYASESAAGFRTETSPLLRAILDWVGFFVICAVLVATFITAVSWTMQALLKGRPLATTYACQPAFTEGKRVKDEEMQYTPRSNLFEDGSDDGCDQDRYRRCVNRAGSNQR